MRKPWMAVSVRWVLGLVLAGVMGLGGAARAEPEPLSSDVKVEQRTYAVRLSDGRKYQVVGFLYTQGGARNQPLQLLIHGITYTHAYWDLPEVNHQDYSYARYMARQGYAVLALDLPGTGLSDRPEGDFFNLAESVSTLHQVAQQVKDPRAREHFDDMVFVGHSNGSLIATYTQAQYRDARAVVLTGWLNTPHALPVDPSVFASLLQEGPYIQAPPELRTAFFYDAPHADPAVIAVDNQLADTVTRGQFQDLLARLADPSPIPTRGIDVPLMVQLGENDAMAPAAYAPNETKAYPRSPWLFVDTVPDIGHAVNGHYLRLRSWTMIDLWLRLAMR